MAFEIEFTDAFFSNLSTFFVLFGLFLGFVFFFVFRPMGLRRSPRTILLLAWKYKWHYALFLVFFFGKNVLDLLNDTVRYSYDLNFTSVIASYEQGFIWIVQNFLENAILTLVLGLFYLIGYLFINFFAVIFFTYTDDETLANRMSLNYLVIYALAIPFYMWIPVQITGHYIAGVDMLLYREMPTNLPGTNVPWSAVFHRFFTAVDPLDNSFPSLHVAMPFSMLLILWRTTRTRDEWKYRRFFWFLVGMNAIFWFAVVYLGVHWVTDIVGGILLAFVGVFVIENLSPRLWPLVRRLEDRVAAWVPWPVPPPPPPPDHGHRRSQPTPPEPLEAERR